MEPFRPIPSEGHTHNSMLYQASGAQEDQKVHACVAWSKGFAMQLKVGKEVDRPTVGIQASRAVEYVVDLYRPIIPASGAQKDHRVHACVAWSKGYAMQLKVGKEVDRPTVGI